MKKLLQKYLISFAYFLESSDRYIKFKRFIYNLLNNDDYPLKRYFDIFMIFLVFSSVAILIDEVHHPIAKALLWYDQYFVTGVFLIEYFLRLWVYNDIHKIIINHYEESQFFNREFSIKSVLLEILRKKWEFITLPSSIIDLIAILPSYREVRILRVFIIFRIFKMLRYSKSLGQFFDILKNKRVELYTLFILLVFVVLVSSVMIYVFEGNGKNPNIKSLFDAIYWSLVTITTVGYGDISPVTTEGRVVSMFIIIAGIGSISFLTSIIVSAFEEQLPAIKANRVLNQTKNLKFINVICGYGKIGQLIARKFKEQQEEFLVIESDPQKVEKAEIDGVRVLKADATKSATFMKIDICNRVKSIIAVTHDDITNIFITINARSLCKDVEIIARCSDNSLVKKLELAGANHIIVPEEMAAMMGAVYIGQPVAFDALQAILAHKRNARVDEIEVKLGSFLDGARLRDVDFLGGKISLIAVLKNKAICDKKVCYKVEFFPDKDYVLESGDILVVMGYSIAILDFKARVESSVKLKKKR
ncbi:MAG: potassium transporter TrkA [Epsilonproteobacteria bacterium]|nr:potassium transporter TrkA [Campylobacterota bacterium]